MTFGERLNATRKQQGRTAQEVANVLGIPIVPTKVVIESQVFLRSCFLLIFWTCLLIICCAAMNFSQNTLVNIEQVFKFVPYPNTSETFPSFERFIIPLMQSEIIRHLLLGHPLRLPGGSQVFPHVFHFLSPLLALLRWQGTFITSSTSSGPKPTNKSQHTLELCYR